mgnify:CR=1 FL=1
MSEAKPRIYLLSDEASSLLQQDAEAFELVQFAGTLPGVAMA